MIISRHSCVRQVFAKKGRLPIMRRRAKVLIRVARMRDYGIIAQM